LIVVSVGTDHHRFDRLLEWVAAAADQVGAEVIAQSGSTPALAGIECFDFVAADELELLMRRADAVVCHGGPGTISLARRAGHRPIVVARDPEFGEHVDDHQLRFAAALAAEDVVDSAASIDDLVDLLAAPRVMLDESADETTGEAVREFGMLVDGLNAGELPARPWRSRFHLRRVDRSLHNSGSR
jgi:UDP-N-acetylglucosamine transferase subunit ALG13